MPPNYPNPLNPRTILPIVMPQAGQALLTIHDQAGRLVSIVLDVPLAAGRHDVVWQGTGPDARPLPSGVYTARLKASGEIRTLSLILCR